MAEQRLQYRQAQSESSISLSTPDTIKFIQLYQQQEILWNPSVPEHTNKNIRTECHKVMAAKMGNNWTDYQVRDKILSLRSRYSKELVKVRVSISSGTEVYTPVWRFFPLLDSFLRPHCITRKLDTPVVRAFQQKLLYGRSGGAEASSPQAMYVNLPATSPSHSQEFSSANLYPAQQQQHIFDADLQIISDDDSKGNDDVEIYLDEAQSPDLTTSAQKHSLSETMSVQASSLERPTQLQATVQSSNSLDVATVSTEDGAKLPSDLSTTSEHINSNLNTDKSEKSTESKSENNSLLHEFNLQGRMSLKREKQTTPPSPPPPPLPSRRSTSSPEDKHFQNNSLLPHRLELQGQCLNDSNKILTEMVSKHCSEPTNKRIKIDDSNAVCDFNKYMFNLMQSLVTTMMDKPKNGTVDTEADSVFSNYIACELRKLDDDLKCDVKFNIQKVIYEAQKQMASRKQK